MTAPLEIVIYHNPRCGKSRAALALLQERGIEPQVVEYLKTPLTKEALRTLVKKLGIEPEALVRKGEEIYKEHYKDRTLSADAWLSAMTEYPILMERPIVEQGAKAVVGRPPEKVLELLA